MRRSVREGSYIDLLCHVSYRGCQKSYPEICKVIKMNPQLQSEFKFVKVC